MSPGGPGGRCGRCDRCLLALCLVHWSGPTAAARAARLSTADARLEPLKAEMARPAVLHTCNLGNGNYTMSNLSEIPCSNGKTLKDIFVKTENSSDKWVFAPGVSVQIVGKSSPPTDYRGHTEERRTRLEARILLLPGATLHLEALYFQGKVEVDGTSGIEVDGTSSGQSRMSHFTFVNCTDEKQRELAALEEKGIRDPSDPSAHAWDGWLIVKDATLTLQIHGSHLTGGAFVKESTGFNFLASRSRFFLQNQGFQLVNVTSHIQLDDVVVGRFRGLKATAFKLLCGRQEVHVARSTFFGSAFDMVVSKFAGCGEGEFDTILNVSSTRFFGGQRAISVEGGGTSQVHLQDVEIRYSSYGVEIQAPTVRINRTSISWTQHTAIDVGSSADVKLENIMINEAGIGLKAYGLNAEFFATGVSISKCSMAVACAHCDSLSMEDVLIAGNDKALETGDGTEFQVSKGLVFFNSWYTLTINKGKGASVLTWSRLPCALAIALSFVACESATILSRMGLEQHFSQGGFETTSNRQRWKYIILTGTSLLLWILVVEAVVAASLLCTMRWNYAHQQEVHSDIVRPNAIVWIASLLANVAAAVIYLYVRVVRRRADIKTLADLKRTEMLLQQKDGLKASLDNIELREEMDRIQLQMFLAKTTGDQVKVQETFDEMKSKAEEEASRLAEWYPERCACYALEDAGARLTALESIPSQNLAEAVQLPLPITDESESLDMLCAMASWLCSSFKDQLVKVCTDRNNVKSRADLQNLGFDEMPFDPATHPLQPEANATIGKHVGLLVAPVKSKDRAQAKVMTDYKEDQAAGKKSELPLARYVCDFLRATIFASDPYVLAVAFWQLQKEFEFVRVKNKFGEEGLRPELRTNILVNLWVKHGDCAQIGEVQFLLQDYLTAKSLQHLYYDVARAASPEELWGKPIFR